MTGQQLSPMINHSSPYMIAGASSSTILIQVMPTDNMDSIKVVNTLVKLITVLIIVICMLGFGIQASSLLPLTGTHGTKRIRLRLNLVCSLKG